MKPMSERYEWIKAIVSCGELRLEYRLEGSLATGHWAHDEDVSEWTDDEIRRVAAGLISAEDQEKEIQVEWR